MQAFPGGTVVKKTLANAQNVGLILGSGRSLEMEMELQYSCLGNMMNKRTWQVTVHGVTKESDTT